MRILVLGDSYCPAAALRTDFEGMSAHSLRFTDVIDDPSWRPTTPSESLLREYLGTPAQVIAALDGHEVLVVQGAPITDAVIAAAPALKLICVTRGGPVNVDIGAATARGIPVVTTPGKNATAVAELTIAVMIMVARRLPEAVGHVLAGRGVFVDNYEGASWFGHELAGHTLGLVGFGQVGRRVAARAKAFEMRMLTHDPYVSVEIIRAQGVEAVDLDQLLDEADHVSLHARATAENRGMFGAAQFERMKTGAYFVNTARDVLVDEEALDSALRSGHLAGAALDIATPALDGSRHRLLGTPNVVLLPHIGGATWETLANGSRMAIEEIERFVSGRPLENVANPSVLEADGTAP